MADVPAFAETLTTSVTSTERENLKENLYTIDVQVFQYFLQQLEAAELHRKSKYSDYSILGILASIKDTLTGFLLYYTFILYQEDKENISLDADLLLKIYIIDVLNITEEYYPFFAQLFDSMAQKRKPLRELRI